MIRITGVGLLLLLAAPWGGVCSAQAGGPPPAASGAPCAWLPGVRDALRVPLRDEFGDEYLLPRELVRPEDRVAYA